MLSGISDIDTMMLLMIWSALARAQRPDREQISAGRDAHVGTQRQLRSAQRLSTPRGCSSS